VGALLLARVLFLIPSARFLLSPALLLLVTTLLVAFLLHLALPFIKEDARRHLGFGLGRFPNLDVALENAGGVALHLLYGHLALRVN
jgi:hypothetical protein